MLDGVLGDLIALSFQWWMEKMHLGSLILRMS
jgi:hypothetical protein